MSRISPRVLAATNEPLTALYDVALLDLDGVVYIGPEPIPGAAAALAKARAAGMRLAFSQSAADLSGISNAPLSIDKVLQEAFIEVNDTGTEAAAATFVGMGLKSRHVPAQEPKIFHADHPFLYLIRDRKTGAVLFLGRVAGLGG